jgi:heme-degrading monooxygenase HmoA
VIAVIFEVHTKPERHHEYLDLAAALRADLEAMPGFISVERFQSLVAPGKILSLSFWEDEAAVRGWREHAQHHQAQLRGREGIFLDYCLRVAAVIRDYGMVQRDQAPQDMPPL